jgi:hypothetical protein
MHKVEGNIDIGERGVKRFRQQYIGGGNFDVGQVARLENLKASSHGTHLKPRFDQPGDQVGADISTGTENRNARFVTDHDWQSLMLLFDESLLTPQHHFDPVIIYTI